MAATWGVSLHAAAKSGNVEVMQGLVREAHATDPDKMTDEHISTQLATAARAGKVEAMSVLLQHAADAASVLMFRGCCDFTALMCASEGGHVDAMRLLLDHPCAEPAAMMARAATGGATSLILAATYSHVDALRLLLDHPLGNPAAIMMQTDSNGENAFMAAIVNGQMDAMRVLLDHLSSNPAAMLAACNSVYGHSTLTLAASFCVGRLQAVEVENPPSCAPLLLLLHRVPMAPQLCESHQARMTKVMQALFQKYPQECDEPVDLFSVDHPNNARDECVRLLLEHGAGGYNPSSPVMRRIISERCALARAPQLLNEAVMGVAIARQQQ